MRNLVESVRPDTTDWFYGAIHGIIGLAQLEEPDPTSTITPNELTTSDINNNNTMSSNQEGPVSELGLHPSIYLRLALSLDWGMSNSELPNADQLSSCLLRMFATSSVNRIRTILNEGLTHRGVRSPSDVLFASTGTTSNENDHHQQQQNSPGQYLGTSTRDLDWAEQDQAILFGLQLGIISPGMAMDWAEDVEVPSPESLPTSDEGAPAHQPQTPLQSKQQDNNNTMEHNAKWKEIAGQAFSDTVDIPERNVLDAFIFRDQLPGEREQRLQDVAAADTPINRDGGNGNPRGSGYGELYAREEQHEKWMPTVTTMADAATNMAMATTLLEGLGPGQDIGVDEWTVQ